MAINILDKLANLRDNAFLYGESTSIMSQLIVRRGPGRTEKRMPTKSINEIISFLFLGEGGATELATAQSQPFLIGLGALGSIVPNAREGIGRWERLRTTEANFRVTSVEHGESPLRAGNNRNLSVPGHEDGLATNFCSSECEPEYSKRQDQVPVR